MTNLTDKITTVTDQMSEDTSTIATILANMNDTLGLLNTALDTLNNNQATNTKYLLAAIGANSPCAPCPTPSLEVPPLDSTPVEPTDEQCQRAQALVHALQALAAKFDVLNNFGVGFNPTVALAGIQEVLDGIGEVSPIPAPSWSEVANIVSWSLAYATANFTVGVSLSEYLSPLVFTLRDAFFNCSSAAEAQSALDTALAGASVPYGAKQLLRALLYNDLCNYYLDPGSSPTLSGFDGTVCSEVLPTECITRHSNLVDLGGFTRDIIYLNPGFVGYVANVIGSVSGTVHIYGTGDPDATLTTTPQLLVSDNINDGINKIWIQHEGGEFSIQVCPAT